MNATRRLDRPAYRAFLARLIAARADAGLTQQDVAVALAVPEPLVAKMESGKELVDVGQVIVLARLYRKPFGFFAGELPECKSTKTPREVRRG